MVEVFFQVLIYGICIGALYGLAASGLALIFGVMDVLQIAHGSIVMLGAYACFWLYNLLRIDPLLSLPVVGVLFFVVGALLFILLFAPITKYSAEARVKNSMLLAFGLILVIDNLTTMAWTGNIRTVNPFYQGLAFRFGGLHFPYVGLISLGLAGFIIIGLGLFLKKTYTGKSIRATAQSAESASLSGINVRRTYLAAIGIGTALGAAAGVLVLLSSGVDPAIGMDWTLKSLLVTVLAGTGNVAGVFVCGLFFGVLESVGSMVLGPYKEVIGLALFVVILFVRPQGLFSGSLGKSALRKS
jgi:branched-chain amino acid transport system permease protein